MDDAEVKESRRMLRQVQDHLFLSHRDMGAERETIGMVDVVCHLRDPLPDLNYVTPRRNTAWVSSSFIEQGLEKLRQAGRSARVQYIEGLFPPLFARTVRELGMEVERETPLMIYSVGLSKPLGEPPPAPGTVHVEAAHDQRGIELWWYIWRNAYYEVLTLGVEPLVVGRDMAAICMGKLIDLIVYRGDFPVGAVRISIQTENRSAHLVALALMHDVRTEDMTRHVYAVALRAALERGVDLVFAPGQHEEDRAICRALGFMDVSSILCYAATKSTDEKIASNGFLAQPVLTLR